MNTLTLITLIIYLALAVMFIYSAILCYLSGDELTLKITASAAVFCLLCSSVVLANHYSLHQ